MKSRIKEYFLDPHVPAIIFLFCFVLITFLSYYLGLTALKSDEVCDLMHKDYPEMYQVQSH